MAEQSGESFTTGELSDFLGAGAVPFPSAVGRPFQPWHRPRKQFVRDVQWAREIRFLVRDLGLEGGELRYLTLPGNDLMDIRHLARSVCQEKGLTLRYLGFNTAAVPTDPGQSVLNSSQFSVNRLTNIHPESEVFPGDFRHVGNSASVPSQRVRRDGPFHAINLDLCGGFAGEVEIFGMPNYFTALKALLQNQAHIDGEFLLFITTRMDRTSLDEDTLATLRDVAQDVRDTCQEYADALVEAWGIERERAYGPIADSVGFEEGLTLGLTQWIVSQGAGLGLKAKVCSFVSYRTGPDNGEDDIISLAIRFKPEPLVVGDDYGLVRPHSSQVPVAERICAQSSSIPTRVANRVRVDELLKVDPAVFDRCLTGSKELLAASGYDAAAYEAWVMQEAERYAIA